ncbi:MAG: tetratricopeptide repeat protein [Gemmatimonas sp.]
MAWRLGQVVLRASFVALTTSGCVPANQLGGQPVPPVWFGANGTSISLPQPYDGQRQALRVDKVALNGPADGAGLHEGDLLLSFDGKPVSSTADLLSIESEIREPRSVPVRLLRDGAARTVEVKLQQRPGQAAPPAVVWLGASLKTVEVPAPNGREAATRIEFMLPESPAAVAGLREDDIIVRFDDKPAGAADDLVRTIAAVRDPRPVPVVFLRDGERHAIDVALGVRPSNVAELFKAALIQRISDEQRIASQTSTSGDVPAAFDHYVAAMRLLIRQQAEYGANVTDIFTFDVERLAEILPRLPSAPRTPREAERHTSTALAVIREAVRDHDNDRAAAALSDAIYEAPWLADLYRNRGLVYAKAGYPEAAAADLTRYLALVPEAADASTMKAKIAGLNALAELRKPWYPYLRSWTMERGGTESVVLRDRRLTVLVQMPANNALTPGDVLCSGSIDGRQFRGTCTNYVTAPNVVRCFGPKIEVPAEGGIDADGTLSIRYLGDINYNTRSCIINSQQSTVYRTFPAPKG